MIRRLKTINNIHMYIWKSLLGCSEFSITFVIFIAICGVVYIQLTYQSLDDREDIFVTHFIITIKSEVSTFPIIVIFFLGCLSEVVVNHHILSVASYRSQKSWVFVSITTVQSMVYVNDLDIVTWTYTYVCTLHPYLIIIIIQPPKYWMWGEWPFSQLSLYNARCCVFSAYPFLSWWLWEYFYFMLLSSNRKYDSLGIA